MAVDERRRKALYDALERQIGPEEATTLMELLPPVGWADVATKEDLRQLDVRFGNKLDAKLERGLRRVIQWNVGVLLTGMGLTFAASKLI